MPNDQSNVPCQQKNSNSLQKFNQVIAVYDMHIVLLGATANISGEGRGQVMLMSQPYAKSLFHFPYMSLSSFGLCHMRISAQS